MSCCGRRRRSRSRSRDRDDRYDRHSDRDRYRDQDRDRDRDWNRDRDRGRDRDRDGKSSRHATSHTEQAPPATPVVSQVNLDKNCCTVSENYRHPENNLVSQKCQTIGKKFADDLHSSDIVVHSPVKQTPFTEKTMRVAWLQNFLLYYWIVKRISLSRFLNL